MLYGIVPTEVRQKSQPHSLGISVYSSQGKQENRSNYSIVLHAELGLEHKKALTKRLTSLNIILQHIKFYNLSINTYLIINFQHPFSFSVEFG